MSPFLFKFAIGKDLPMDALDNIKLPVRHDLEHFNEMFKATLTTSNPILNKALEHIVKRQGKQMRPMLTLLSARLFLEADALLPDSVLHAAIALELLHTASLVHDDVVDESDMRRGQQSLNSLLSSKSAVLVGDFLLSKSIEHASVVGDIRVPQCVAELGKMLVDGELLQLVNIDSDSMEESAYYEVIRKKTASLFATCAHLGSVIAGADEGSADLMKRFGMLLGICFQLRDDMFDYDSGHDVGKPAGNDMKEGKLTLPVLFAARRNKSAHELALKVRRGTASEEEISVLVHLTYDEGGIIYAEKAMQDFTGMAEGLLDDFDNPAVVGSLLSYLHFVSRRTI